MTKRKIMAVWTPVVLALALLSGCGPEEPQVMNVSAPVALRDARDVLYTEVKSSADIVRFHAIEAMDYSLGSEAGDIYVAGLTDPASGVRFASAMAIGDTEYAEGGDAVLLRLTEEEDQMVRPGLIYAAYRLGDSSHMAELPILLNAPNPWVRANTALVMGKVNHPSAKDCLRNLLMDETDENVKIRAHESYAMLGDVRSARQLEGFAKRPFVDDQVDAILGLARIGGERAKVECRRLFDAENTAPVAKVAAVGGLGRMGVYGKDGYDYSIRALNEPYTVLKEAYPKKEITPDEVRSLQQMAVTSLGWLGNQLAVNDLYPMLQSGDGSIRVAAARSIYQLLPNTAGYDDYVGTYDDAAPGIVEVKAVEESTAIKDDGAAKTAVEESVQDSLPPVQDAPDFEEGSEQLQEELEELDVNPAAHDDAGVDVLEAEKVEPAESMPMIELQPAQPAE